MKGFTNKHRADRPHDTSSSQAVSHSTDANSDDEKAVELSNLYHPCLTRFVSKNPVYTESQGKDEHSRLAREPLGKDSMGPLAEDVGSGNQNSIGSSIYPTQTVTSSPAVTQFSTHSSVSGHSYAQPSKAQTPLHPLQPRDKNRMGEVKHSNIITFSHSPSTQNTLKTPVSVPSTSQSSDTTYPQLSPTHQSHVPLTLVYPPACDDPHIRKPQHASATKTTSTHTRLHSISPPYEEDPPWDPKNPTTTTTTDYHYPPTASSFSSNSREPHTYLENNVAYDTRHAWSHPHLPRRNPVEPNRFRNNLDANVDLNGLGVASWCGTDLVGSPSMFSTHPGQARADDARHKRVERWNLAEQHMRTHWHPQRYLRKPTRGQGTGGSEAEDSQGGKWGRERCLISQDWSHGHSQGGYADYGLLDQKDEVSATAKWAFEIEAPWKKGGGEGEDEKGDPILVPIRDTSARLVDMAVSREQAEKKALFLPPIRRKHVAKTEETERGVLQFLVSTIANELRFLSEKDKDKGKDI